MAKMMVPIIQNVGAIITPVVTTVNADVGRGGALIESKPLDRRVVDSNPALAAK